MPIIVDGNELNLSVPIPNDKSNDEAKKKWNDLTENERWVISEMATYRRNKKSIKIQSRRKLDEYYTRTKPHSGCPVAGRQVNKETGVREHWIYSDKQPKTINNNKVYTTKHLSFFHQQEIPTDTHADLVFMLMNIVNLSAANLEIEDRAAIAQKKLDLRKKASQVENWIYNTLTDNEVKAYAYRHGITDLDDKETEEIRIELFEYVQSQESRENVNIGFKSFLDEVNSESDVIKVGSYFYGALHKREISFDPSNRTVFWTSNSEIIGPTIPPQMYKHNKEEFMIQWLVNNPTQKKLFLESINPKALEDVREVNDDWRLLKVPAQRRSWAKENLGLDVGLVSLDESAKKIEEHLKKAEESKEVNASA